MFDIIFFAAFAVFIGFRLYKTLGMKDFNESSMKQKPEDISSRVPDTQSPVIDGSFREVKNDEAEYEKMSDKYGILIASKIRDIQKYDANFSDEYFINGAKYAFEMIIKAFSKGDIEALKPLLSKDMMKGFASEIERRKAEGKTEETTLLAIKEAKIKDIELYSKVAKISVEFTSEQINLIKDASGKIIEGDASQVDNVDEIWTFARNLSSSNPNWELINTVGA